MFNPPKYNACFSPVKFVQKEISEPFDSHVILRLIHTNTYTHTIKVMCVILKSLVRYLDSKPSQILWIAGEQGLTDEGRACNSSYILRATTLVKTNSFV